MPPCNSSNPERDEEGEVVGVDAPSRWERMGTLRRDDLHHRAMQQQSRRRHRCDAWWSHRPYIYCELVDKDARYRDIVENTIHLLPGPPEVNFFMYNDLTPHGYYMCHQQETAEGEESDCKIIFEKNTELNDLYDAADILVDNILQNYSTLPQQPTVSRVFSVREIDPPYVTYDERLRSGHIYPDGIFREYPDVYELPAAYYMLVRRQEIVCTYSRASNARRRLAGFPAPREQIRPPNQETEDEPDSDDSSESDWKQYYKRHGDRTDAYRHLAPRN